MIKRINFTNVKGTTRDLALGHMTLITGPQGSGKTSVIDALQLAVLGYHPELGRTAKGIYKLASAANDSLSVSIETTTGQNITRQWKPTGKSIKAISTGEAPPFVVAALDGNAFINAGATARAALIRQLYPAAEDPREALTKAIQAAAPKVRLAWPTADDLNEWQEALADAIAAAKKAAQETSKRMRAALEAATQLGQPSATGATMTAEEGDRLLGADQAAQTALALANAAVKTLENEIHELAHTGGLAAEIQQPEDLPALRAELHRLNAELQAARVKQAAAEAKANESAKAAQARSHHRAIVEDFAQAYPAPLSEPTPPAEILAFDFRAYDQAIADHEAALKALAAAEQAAAEADICPHCGAGREHWSRQAQHQTPPGELEIATLRRAADDAAVKRSQFEAEAQSYNEAAAEHKRTREHYEQQQRAFRAYSMCRAKAEASQQTLATLGEDYHIDDEAEHLAIEIDSLEADIETLQNRIRAGEANEKAIAARTRRLELEESLTWARDEQQTAQAHAAQTAAQAATVLEATAARAAAAERAKAAEQQQAAADEADETAAQCATAADVLKREFASLASAALEPMLASANRYLEGLTMEPLAAIGLELGRWKGETWVTFDTFSGGEKALATCAMQAALAETGPADWRIAFLDEFNTVSGDGNRTGFIGNLAAAISEGTLTQAIVLDNREPEPELLHEAQPAGGTLEIHRLLPQ